MKCKNAKGQLIKKKLRFTLTLFLSVNLVFLFIVPNFHHHNHYIHHHNHSENSNIEDCCSIDHDINIGTYIHQVQNKKGVSESDCPIEKFTETFTSLSIFTFKFTNCFDTKVKKITLYLIISIKYLDIQSSFQRAPPTFL